MSEPQKATMPERIAMCADPAGEHMHIPLTPSEPMPETCFAWDCRCAPVEYVPASRLQEAACSHRTIAEWSALEARLQEATKRLRAATKALRIYLDHRQRGLDLRPGWLEEEVEANDDLLAALDSLGEAPG